MKPLVHKIIILKKLVEYLDTFSNRSGYLSHVSFNILNSFVVDVAIDHVICELVIRLADSLESTTADDYLLKVHGKTEYLHKYAFAK